MRSPTALAAGSVGLMGFLGLLHAQRPFKEYPAIEYEDFALPPDWKDQKHEWVRAPVFAIPIFSVTLTIRASACVADALGPASGPWITRGRTGTCFRVFAG